MGCDKDAPSDTFVGDDYEYVIPSSTCKVQGDSAEPCTVVCRKRFVDHTLVAWIVENMSIAGVAVLAAFVKQSKPFRLPERRSFASVFIHHFSGSMVLIESSIAIQKFLVKKVYAHIPYFSDAGRRQSQQSFRKTFYDWLRCNFVTYIASTSVVTGIMLAEPIQTYKRRLQSKQSFSIIHFLGKLAAVRFISDIVFYCVHRALHTKQLYRLHKRHHEHTATALNTNYHFSCADLLLEGFYPILHGVGALHVINIRMNCLEEDLIASYFQWYEIGSHSGKPVPTVTFFPPLAPLYKSLLGDVDKRNIEFHDQHHFLRNCNYGISQWLDHLLGTARFSPRRSASLEDRPQRRRSNNRRLDDKCSLDDRW